MQDAYPVVGLDAAQNEWWISGYDLTSLYITGYEFTITGHATPGHNGIMEVDAPGAIWNGGGNRTEVPVTFNITDPWNAGIYAGGLAVYENFEDTYGLYRTTEVIT